MTTIDHIKPQADGGRTTITNLRLAHQLCNKRRGCGPAHKAFAGYV